MPEKAAELFEISGFRVGSASGAEFLRRNQPISSFTPVFALPYFISGVPLSRHLDIGPPLLQKKAIGSRR